MNPRLAHILLCLSLATSLACGPLDGAGDFKPPPAFAEKAGTLTIATTLQNGVASAPVSGAQASFTWLHFDLPAGATNLTLRMGTGTSATNDADLYVRAGGESTASFDCMSYAIGLTDACTLPAPIAGPYSILIYGYTSYTGAIVTATWTAAAAPPPPPPPPAHTLGASVSVHLQLGVPDASSTSVTMPDHYLSVRPQFAMSYNATKKEPNWVSWELNQTYLGAADRTSNFRLDSLLPSPITQAALADYVGSGFDRGHLCPSADRTLSATDNAATFVLTNVLPQAPDSNRGPWEKLETYERSLVQSGKELTIIAGGLYGPLPRTIGNGVVVPDSMFKVIVVADAPGAAAISAQTRVIAVVVPNDNALVSQSDDWKKFRTSARAIETSSGLNFLADVPQDVQDAIEPSVDAL